MQLDQATLKTIRLKLGAELVHPVELLLFTTDRMTGSVDNRGYNEFAERLCQELTGMSTLLSFQREGLFGERGTALDLALSPTLLIGGCGLFPVQYWGVPTGSQGGIFIETIIMASRRNPDLAESSRRLIAGLDLPVVLESFLTPDCPFCAQAALSANRIALASAGLITARCLDVTQGMDRAVRFDVASVPHFIINGDPLTATVGLQDEATLVNLLLHRR